MSNEIQKSNPVGVVTTTAPATVGFNFFDPMQFETMQRVCKMFASSDLVPDIYRATMKSYPATADENTVKNIQAENQAALTKAMANCMIAVDYAMRVGASPLMVMQNVAIIYGRPAPASKFLIATVNSCGKFETLQFRFKELGALGMVEYTDYVWNDHTRRKEAVPRQFDGRKVMNIECVAYTSKKGSKEVLESSPVTIRLAVEERWYTKDGSKWPTMPRLMLMYRAASMWTNTYAPELSMGMRTIEEQQDIVDVEFEEIPTPPAATANNTASTISMDDAKPATDPAPASPEPANQEAAAPEAKAEPAPAAPESTTDNPGF